MITGSGGLIGKSLSQRLNKFYHVKPFDNNLPEESDGYGEILSPDILQQRVEYCDGVIHLAAVSRVIWGERQPELCWQTNVEGTRHVLDAAYNAPKKPWVLYASSREVYGQQQVFPVRESAPLQPLNHYARSKVAAEELVEKYSSKGLQTAVIRFSSVYGDIDDHHDRVVPAFCRAAATGAPIHIEGENNTFDFTHVTDVVEGILKVIAHLEAEHEVPTIHLTSGQPVSLKTLAELALRHGKHHPDYIIEPPRTFDVSKFYGDISLAQQLLDWVPEINLETGISKLVNDFYQEKYK